MKNRYLLLAGCCLVLSGASAQTAADYAVQTTVTVQTSPPQITLRWKPVGSVTSWNVFRKAKTATAWTSLSTGITDTTYTDGTVVTDSAYEYKITGTGGTYPAGYVYAGIRRPAVHSRGSIVVVCDTLIRDSCEKQVNHLIKDLSNDGWTVYTRYVRRDLPDVSVKELIKTLYVKAADLKAALLLGHVAVPYSGAINPDGHGDHYGAWSADVYYGDMDGTWNDVSVNTTSASRPENRNIPGDGKWDPSVLPSPVELQIGRIDFANMPVFGRSEVQMARTYLDKAHAYKNVAMYTSKKGLIDDNFGAFGGEAFAANGWRNFAPLTGNVFSGDLITSMNDSAYRWAYGCGGGSYTSCGGVGNTSDFATNNFKGIFSILFGSYFGDWDSQNNFLRAPLCAPDPALTSCWAGRPNWFFHHMALGETIGYSARITQNNTSLYTPANYGANWIHVALMGDPSLRNDYISPASKLAFTPLGGGGHRISWTASPDEEIAGYYIYTADSEYGPYTLKSNLVTGNSWNDIAGTNGLHYYMVRPVKLETTASGTYYNLGLGISASATVSYATTAIAAADMPAAELVCYPNPAGNVLNMYIHTTQQHGDFTVLLSDLQGRTIQEFREPAASGSTTISRDISQLTPGIYMLQVKTATGLSLTRKIVKQ